MANQLSTYTHKSVTRLTTSRKTTNVSGGSDMKYRKKPVVVEAIQFTGTNYEKIKEFIG
ncbi:TPA: hypothetical protein VHI02_000639 [Streptococcus pyogenes]|nr:hypothetical protein [Streptococcus pyogenes]